MNGLVPRKQKASPALHSIATWDVTGVTFVEAPTTEELAEDFIKMEAWETGTSWAMVDILLKVDEVDPLDGLATVAQWSKKSPERLKVMLWAGKRFPKERRVPELELGHHEAVAAKWLSDERQEELLRLAVENQWSVSRLATERNRVKALSAGEETEPLDLLVQDVKAFLDELEMEYAGDPERQNKIKQTRDLVGVVERRL